MKIEIKSIAKYVPGPVGTTLICEPAAVEVGGVRLYSAKPNTTGEAININNALLQLSQNE